jgi:hypothetical protein
MALLALCLTERSGVHLQDSPDGFPPCAGFNRPPLVYHKWTPSQYQYSGDSFRSNIQKSQAVISMPKPAWMIGAFVMEFKSGSES